MNFNIVQIITTMILFIIVSIWLEIYCMIIFGIVISVYIWLKSKLNDGVIYNG